MLDEFRTVCAQAAPPSRSIPAAFDRKRSGGAVTKATLFAVVPRLVLWETVLPYLPPASLSAQHAMSVTRTLSMHYDGDEDDDASVSVDAAQQLLAAALQPSALAALRDDDEAARVVQAAAALPSALRESSSGECEDIGSDVSVPMRASVALLPALQVRAWCGGLVSLSLTFSPSLLLSGASNECLLRTFRTGSPGTVTLESLTLKNASINSEVMWGVASHCPRLIRLLLLKCWDVPRHAGQFAPLSTSTVFAIVHAPWCTGLRTLTVTGEYSRHVLLSQIFLRAYKSEILNVRLDVDDSDHCVEDTEGFEHTSHDGEDECRRKAACRGEKRERETRSSETEESEDCPWPSGGMGRHGGVPLSDTLRSLRIGCRCGGTEQLLLSDLQRVFLAARRLELVDVNHLHLKWPDILPVKEDEDGEEDDSVMAPLFLPSNRNLEASQGIPETDETPPLTVSALRDQPRGKKSGPGLLIRSAVSGPLPPTTVLQQHSQKLLTRARPRPTPGPQWCYPRRVKSNALLAVTEHRVIFTEDHCEALCAEGVVAAYLPLFQGELQERRMLQAAADARDRAAREAAKRQARAAGGQWRRERADIRTNEQLAGAAAERFPSAAVVCAAGVVRGAVHVGGLWCHVDNWL